MLLVLPLVIPFHAKHYYLCCQRVQEVSTWYHVFLKRNHFLILPLGTTKSLYSCVLSTCSRKKHEKGDLSKNWCAQASFPADQKQLQHLEQELFLDQVKIKQSVKEFFPLNVNHDPALRKYVPRSWVSNNSFTKSKV